MKIFGSDGYRSKYGEKYLTDEYINRFAKSVTKVKPLIGKKAILIARDTRKSGILIEKKIIKIFCKYGIDTFRAGIIPSPCVSSLLKSKKFSLGIMITASHNPAEDNGIKLFSKSGKKLEKRIENIIEKEMNKGEFSNLIHLKGKSKKIKLPYLKYIHDIQKAFSFKKPQHKIIIDCSNGAVCKLVDEIFKEYNNVLVINNHPNGYNINYKCGALHPEKLYSKVKAMNYDYGIAFDGDGDRAIFVSRGYKGQIETEKLIILFSQIFKSKKKYIVSSEICNLALKEEIRKIGFKLIESKVGDRHVIDKVKNYKAIMGAEPSGHFYFTKTGFTMDGLSAAMCFFHLLNKYNDSLNESLKKISFYRRITKDLASNSISEKNLMEVRSLLKQQINLKNEKIIIRLSMWDPKIRIYYDYQYKSNFTAYLKIIKGNIKS